MEHNVAKCRRPADPYTGRRCVRCKEPLRSYSSGTGDTCEDCAVAAHAAAWRRDAANAARRRIVGTGPAARVEGGR
jgi:hypothetical protein